MKYGRDERGNVDRIDDMGERAEQTGCVGSSHPSPSFPFCASFERSVSAKGNFLAPKRQSGENGDNANEQSEKQVWWCFCFIIIF